MLSGAGEKEKKEKSKREKTKKIFLSNSLSARISLELPPTELLIIKKVVSENVSTIRRENFDMKTVFPEALKASRVLKTEN